MLKYLTEILKLTKTQAQEYTDALERIESCEFSEDNCMRWSVCSFSEYNNSSFVELSNINFLLNDAPHNNQLEKYWCYASNRGHMCGGVSLVFDVAAISKLSVDQKTVVLEWLQELNNSLTNYPLADYDTYQQLINDQIKEDLSISAHGWLVCDVADNLKDCDKYNILNIDNAQDVINDAFEQALQALGTYPENEAGSSMCYYEIGEYMAAHIEQTL